MSAPPVEDGVTRAVRATGLLADFNAAGVLAPADVHVAARLQRLGHTDDEQVLLAAALAVRAVRMGSVCVDLSEADGTVLGESDQLVDVSALPWPEPADWVTRCAASPLVDGAGPLHLEGTMLYLERYWRQEEQVRLDLAAREAADPPPVDRGRLREGLARLFPDDPPDHQRLAAAVSALRWVSVLAGGPGTGKTHTVARLLALLRDQDPTLRIALAAPTGKAAARMEESVRRQAGDSVLGGLDLHASTIHRLLGRKPGSSSRFRHDRHRRLPVDVVVVDETSMVSLTLMARLLEAVRPDARLILVGDPDQLASVEAGAVLGDLTRAPGEPDPGLEAALREVGVGPDLDAPVVNGVVTLTHNHRNRDEIADIAGAIRIGDADTVLDLLRAGTEGIELIETDGLEARDPAGLEGLRDDVVRGARTVTALAGDPTRTEDALQALDAHRLLCAHRRGPYGVARWAAQVERWLAEDAGAVEPDGEWAIGRPLLITVNDYELGLYNGDTGVVVATDDGVRAAFARGGRPQLVVPARLGEVVGVHAMTVHRSQGSQFARVSVILPPAESPLLTRELLYTAITRAEDHVRLIGTADAVRAAVERPINRASGLTVRR
jgi:exodeoxyribonuclease V alpha subunit